jgi:hypothetical protein
MSLLDFKKYNLTLAHIRIYLNSELGDLFIDAYKKKFIAEYNNF